MQPRRPLPPSCPLSSQQQPKWLQSQLIPIAPGVPQWIEWGIGSGVSQTGDQPARTALEAAQTPYFGGRAGPMGCPTLFSLLCCCKVGSKLCAKDTASSTSRACLPARLPHRGAGLQSPYNASRDPWRNPGVRDYMRYYINQTSAYLLQVVVTKKEQCGLGREGEGAREGSRHPALAEHAFLLVLACAAMRCFCISISHRLQGGCEYHVGTVYLWTVGGSWDVIGM